MVVRLRWEWSRGGRHLHLPLQAAAAKVQWDAGHLQIKTTARWQSDEGVGGENEGEINRKSVFGEGPSFIS